MFKPGYDWVVCHTCMRKHPARKDRTYDELLNFAEKHLGHTVNVESEWWGWWKGWCYENNADIKQAFGTSTGITITLASLAQASAREATAIDNTVALTFFNDALVRFHLKLQTGTPAAQKASFIYVYGSEDGTNYTDNATGSDAAITLRSPTNLKQIGTIAMPDSGALTYKSHPMAVAFAFNQSMPRKWGPVVENQSNITFSATEADHTKAYTGIYHTV